jgi:hypothetical protein
MSLGKKKLVVDVLLFVDFLVLAISGFIMSIFLPAYQKSGQKSFILPRQVWYNIHDKAAWIFLFLVIIHLILSWGWIKQNIFRRNTKDE